MPFSFTKAIQRGLGTATAHSSSRTGLYSGSVVAEQVALGAKYPVVLLLLTAFSVELYAIVTVTYRPAKTDFSACTGRWLRTASTFSRVFS